jgi:hypothetical protein
VENMINSTEGGEIALRNLGGVLSFSFLFSFVVCHLLANSWVLWFSLTRLSFFELVFGFG